ncbi:MAG: hypothetical protein WD049_02800, partial [Candidatus Paceibacterota bacterium]
ASRKVLAFRLTLRLWRAATSVESLLSIITHVPLTGRIAGFVRNRCNYIIARAPQPRIDRMLIRIAPRAFTDRIDRRST